MISAHTVLAVEAARQPPPRDQDGLRLGWFPGEAVWAHHTGLTFEVKKDGVVVGTHPLGVLCWTDRQKYISDLIDDKLSLLNLVTTIDY